MDAGYFGFTDPLTNTWRPKKFKAEGTTVNDGRTWSDSSNLTNITNGADAFDGNLTGDYAHATGAGNSGTINFTNLTSVSTLRLYAREDSREASGKITVNSTDFDFPTTAAWVDVSSALSGGLSSITLKNGSYITALFAIEVDGVVLRNGITTNLAFGTNGFYLPMDNDDFNIDKSGKGNNWTKQNFSGTSIDPDVLKDSPSGAVSGGRAQTGITTTSSAPSNYSTWNPLSKGNINLSDGNLTAIPASNDQSCFATLSIPDNGKVYFEFTCIQRGGGGAQSPIWGVGNPSGVTLALNPQNSDNNASTWLYGGDGNKTGGGSGSTSYGTAFVAGDVIGVCVDRSNSRIWFSKNNVWQNSGNPNNPTDSNAAFTNVTSTGTLIPFYGNNNSTAGYGSVNFGQKPFKYAPPQGFYH